MYGNIGKPRSKFGKFLDKNGITQSELSEVSGVSMDTITRACAPGGELRSISKDKLIKAVRKLTNKPVYEDDFW